MKARLRIRHLLFVLAIASAIWPAPPSLHAQFTCVTNNGTITIKKYTGPGGAVTIPEIINALPVTSIGNEAFAWHSNLTDVTISGTITSIGGAAFLSCTSLTNLTLPQSLTSIGPGAFSICTSLTSVSIPSGVTNIGSAFADDTALTAISVDALNPCFSSREGVLFNKNQTELIQCPGAKGGNYTIPETVTMIGGGAFRGCRTLTRVEIPDAVTSVGKQAFSLCSNLAAVRIGSRVSTIGEMAFLACTSLTSATIPDSVTFLGGAAFGDCTNLQALYFQGNAPALDPDADEYWREAWVFYLDDRLIVYYLPGTTGWGSTFGARPAVLWNPQIQTAHADFGEGGGGFGFEIRWAGGSGVVVEGCVDLAHPSWSPLATNNLASGSWCFSDPQSTNLPARFYRLRSP